MTVQLVRQVGAERSVVSGVCMLYVYTMRSKAWLALALHCMAWHETAEHGKVGRGDVLCIVYCDCLQER